MGWGIIDANKKQQKSQRIASGFISIRATTLPEKLGIIFKQLSAIIKEYQPEQVAIESVFMNKNADSALKLGQARGAAICAAVDQGLTVFEYSPREVKQAVVGNGGAVKEQVQHMVKLLLSLEASLQADEADALAIALCHGHTNTTLISMAGKTKNRANKRWTAAALKGL